MWKSGTFDLKDITEKLIGEIVFFDISNPGMGIPGSVIFITESGDEYIISAVGTDWHGIEMIKLFPNIYEAYKNEDEAEKDKYGFVTVDNWKIIPAFAGELLVRKDYFEMFYAKYQSERDQQYKDFPYCIARELFGRSSTELDERMEYIKNKEYWDKELEEERKIRRKTIQNRLSNSEVPWIKFESYILEGYIRFWIRKNTDETYSGYRWYIQEQKEQVEEGGYKRDAPVECYNLFFKKYENIDVKIIDDCGALYRTYVKNDDAGNFIRSYGTLERAKEAVMLRNEWCGWGNVNKENIFMIDYEELERLIKGDVEIFFY